MRVVLLAAGLALAAPQSRWSEDPGPEGGLLWIDTDQSPVAGAGNVLFLHAAYGRLVDHLLPVRVFAEERGWQRAGNAFWRFGRLFFVANPGASFLPVFQHELYGHGWRAREAGYLDMAYELSAPFPYGYGEGSTSWKYAPSQTPGPDEAIAMSLAGIEATDLLARRLRSRLAASGSLDYHSAQLYAASALGLWTYVDATGDEDTAASNDVVSWLSGVNAKEGHPDRAGWALTRKDLEGPATLSYAGDPFIWFSAAVVLAHIWSGEARWKLPMIPIGKGLRWLPLLGYRLSPYGGQWLVENLVAAKGRVFTLRGAFGGGPAGSSAAGDLEMARFASWRGAELDAAFRFWNQPRLWLDPLGPAPSRSQRPGGGLEVTALSPPLSAAFPLRLALGYGYKGAGYAPGLPLEAGSTVRAGIGLQR